MSSTLIPFRSPLANIWGDLDTELARAFGDDGRAGGAEPTGRFRPDMNMVETEEEFVLTLDLPGIAMNDITIEVVGDELIVSGHREEKSDAKDGKWHHLESRYGRFLRTVRLGRGLLTDGIDARYSDGVLRITVPKADDVKPRRIEIRT